MTVEKALKIKILGLFEMYRRGHTVDHDAVNHRERASWLGNSRRIWVFRDFLTVSGRVGLGERVVDLRPCSSNI